jgi:hypothetical protein
MHKVKLNITCLTFMLHHLCKNRGTQAGLMLVLCGKNNTKKTGDEMKGLFYLKAVKLLTMVIQNMFEFFTICITT